MCVLCTSACLVFVGGGGVNAHNAQEFTIISGDPTRFFHEEMKLN